MVTWKRAHPDAKPDLKEWQERLYSDCMKVKVAHSHTELPTND